MHPVTCPKCGIECSTLFNFVCRDCFFETFKLIELPLILHVSICSNCGAHFHKSRWENIGNIECVLLSAVENVLLIHTEAKDVKVYLEPKEITPYVYIVRVEVDAMVNEELVHAAGETEVRIQRKACDTCSRESGGYFEAIIQIRAVGRFPSEEEKRRCSTISRKFIENNQKKGDRLAFISQTRDTREGLDLYIGSTTVSRQTCRLITSILGGRFAESPTLIGMRDGKNIYRITFAIRLPEFSPGDVVMFTGRIIHIKSSGKKVNGIFLEDGSRFTSTPEEMKGAEKVANIEDAVLTVLVSIEEKAILVLDPESYETVAIKKPLSFSVEAGSEITVLKTPYGIFAMVRS